MNEQDIANMNAYNQKKAVDNAAIAQNQQFLGGLQDDEDLFKYQLDSGEDIMRLENYLRRRVIKYNSQTHQEEYVQVGEPVLNEKGINEILLQVSLFLQKRILLSSHREEDATKRCEQFARFFKDFLYNNAEEFGLDTMEKKRYYPMIWFDVVAIVEAAYFSSVGGGERKSLREHALFTQSQSIDKSHFMQSPSKQSFSLSKPSTWGNLFS